MDIEFDLPVVFNAIPHNRKTKATMVGTVPVTIDLDECSPAELEPVASLRFHGELEDATRYCHRGGHLFVPHCRLEDLPRSFVPYGPKKGFLFDKADRGIRITFDNAVFNAGRGGAYPPELAKARRDHQPFPLLPLDKIKFSEPYQAGIDTQIERLRSRCGRLLVSDGTVHIRVSEPVIGVDLTEENGPTVAWVRPFWRSSHGIDVGKNAPIPPHAVFRLDDEDGLAAFLDAAGVSDPRPEVWRSHTVRVDDPARLLIDSRETSVFSSAARIVKKAQDWIGDHPVIDGIFDLLGGKISDTDYPPLLGDLLAEAIDVHRSGVRVFSNDMDVLGAELVAEMWDARSVTVPLPGLR